MDARFAPTFHLDSIGYPTESTKTATITVPDLDWFAIRDTTSGVELFQLRATPLAKSFNAAGNRFVADFSGVRRPGTYQLVIPSGEASAPFVVSDDVYNWPFYTAVRGMYLWRCGTSVAGEFGGHKFEHAACHLEDGLLDHAGGPAGARKDGVGGWHDAGDYNKYTVNAAFTAGMMLTAWEHFHDRLAGLKLDLPESSNNMPDFLDEIHWELDWLLKMQADDGSVYHKLSALKFNAIELPENETARRYFSPWSSAATASFAAVMAQGARVYEPFDEAFAERCLAAAKKSYEFLKSHPEDHRPDLSAFTTGGYGAPDADDRIWAAAELWETTGNAEYLHDFERRIRAQKATATDGPSTVDVNWDWGNLRNLGMFTYLLSERAGRDSAVVARVRDDVLRAADVIVATVDRHPYGRPLGARYYWGCNGTVARQAMNLHVAHRLTEKPQYRAAMLDAIHYLFGRNPYGRSFVTGLGHAPPQFPHDRRSGGDDIEVPWPGYLVGGPWPKSTDWQDVEEDYRTNETAINWNGALIYALAAFVEPASFAESVERANASNSTAPTRSKDAD